MYWPHDPAPFDVVRGGCARDGLGHYPHLVDPDRFVRRVEEFWTVSG
jgi:hypothetical protein